MRRFLFILCLLSAPLLFADTHTDLLWSANKGDVSAMRKIGIRKIRGASGTPINRDQGIQWLREAIKKGDKESMYQLGRILLLGEYFVRKNVEEGCNLLIQAANQGHHMAHKCLIQKAPLEHINSYLESRAASGDVEAALLLAKACLMGSDGAPGGDADGIKYYLAAAKQNSAKAHAALKSWPKKNAIPVWHHLADEQGDLAAQLYLAEQYDKGSKSLPANPERAHHYYGLAAEAGDINAAAWLKAHALSDETTMKKRENDARMQELMARAESGDLASQLLLARCYRENLDGGQDVVKAAYWLHKAAAGGSVEALAMLGALYDDAENDAMAASFLCQAAEKGHAEAQYRLGMLYCTGRGVDQNLEQAVAWLQKSADQGFAAARRALQTLSR